MQFQNHDSFYVSLLWFSYRQSMLFFQTFQLFYFAIWIIFLFHLVFFIFLVQLLLIKTLYHFIRTLFYLQQPYKIGKFFFFFFLAQDQCLEDTSYQILFQISVRNLFLCFSNFVKLNLLCFTIFFFVVFHFFFLPQLQYHHCLQNYCSTCKIRPCVIYMDNYKLHYNNMISNIITLNQLVVHLIRYFMGQQKINSLDNFLMLSPQAK